MVCAGGIAGEDACQVCEGRQGTVTQARAGSGGQEGSGEWGRVSQGKGMWERAGVRKEGSTGNGGQRERRGGGHGEGRKRRAQRGRVRDTERRASWDMELRQVARLSDSVFPIPPFG